MIVTHKKQTDTRADAIHAACLAAATLAVLAALAHAIMIITSNKTSVPVPAGDAAVMAIQPRSPDLADEADETPPSDLALAGMHREQVRGQNEVLLEQARANARLPADSQYPGALTVERAKSLIASDRAIF